MNIVYYSYNFFPQADAESYCATRFASALARAGHNVVVITMDWPMQVSTETYKALVAEELEIVRLPFSKQQNTPLKALLWYGHISQMAVDAPQPIEMTKKILLSMERPILITRTHPVVSTMVGLKTYQYADKWITHFSDPIPWINAYANTIGHRVLKHLEIDILKRAFLKADAISVTCMHVCKFYKEMYGKAFDTNKVFMTTHIGDYRLDAPPAEFDASKVKRILLHPGSIFANRGGGVIADVMSEFAKNKYDCTFVQVGEVESIIQDKLTDSCNMKIYNTISPELSVKLRDSAKAIFVPDFESEYSYSPFILSKFVYQIMSDKPIVLYAKRDSEMADYAVQYPESAIFWAEYGNVDSLKKAIVDAMEYDNSKMNRKRIRDCFSEKTIVKQFEQSVQRICYEDK